jgi:hypothetical protein
VDQAHELNSEGPHWIQALQAGDRDDVLRLVRASREDGFG